MKKQKTLANQTQTREEWLNNMAMKMGERFKDLGHKFPRIRISCGFTSAGSRGDVVGECWFPVASEDNTHEIFISPDQSTGTEVAAVLCHELCHVVVGPQAGHGRDFYKLCTDMHLEGKATATVGGADFSKYIKPIIKQIGKYPHAKLNAVERAPWKKIQPNYPHKNIRCPECGYYAKGTVEYLKLGRLMCPIDGEMLLTTEERKKRAKHP